MFAKILAPKTEPAYAFLRVVVGLLFAFHGMQGLFGIMLPPEYKAHFPTQGWFGGVIELVAGFLIAGGLWADCAAFVASGTMAVAYVQFHWKLNFGAQFFPAVNQGELSLVYSVLFLYMACKGSGIFSIDKLRKRKSAL